jgi:hypothetical protein
MSPISGPRRRATSAGADSIAMRDIAHPQLTQVAGSELAVDGQMKQREIANPALSYPSTPARTSIAFSTKLRTATSSKPTGIPFTFPAGKPFKASSRLILARQYNRLPSRNQLA